MLWRKAQLTYTYLFVCMYMYVYGILWGWPPNSEESKVKAPLETTRTQPSCSNFKLPAFQDQSENHATSKTH